MPQLASAIFSYTSLEYKSVWSVASVSSEIVPVIAYSEPAHFTVERYSSVLADNSFTRNNSP